HFRSHSSALSGGLSLTPHGQAFKPELNAFAYLSIRMHIVCRLITPAIRSLSFLSSRANGRYEATWAVESRTPIAFLSPVTTNVSGRPLRLPNVTVVSRVLG